MDNRKSADDFYACIGMSRPKVSPDEKASITTIATKVLAFLEQMRGGPYTLLLPDGDKLGSLGLETEQLDQAALDGFTGWFMDLVFFGNALSTSIDQALDAADDKLELSSVGGSSVTVTRENGAVVLTDPWGVRAVVSEALFKGRSVTAHSIDNLIMWDAWKEHILQENG